MVLATGFVNAQTYFNPVVIDFENGSIIGSGYGVYDEISDYPWTVADAHGGKVMKSSNEGVASSTSAIAIEFSYWGFGGHISFDAECCGEETSSIWDKCEFYINDELQFTHGADVSGWNHYTYEIPEGSSNIVFKWSYTKDSSVNPTGDYFAVDNIEFKRDPHTISEVYVTGFTAPEWGEHPDFSISTPSGYGYSIWEISISWHGNYDVLNENSIFNHEDYNYYMTFYIEHENDYVFDENVTVYINDSTSLVGTKEITNDGYTLTVNTIYFTVTAPPVPCPLPSNLQTNNISYSTATLTWDGEADSYTLRYKPIYGSSSWTVVEGITENSYTITNAQIGGYYEVEVKSTCDTDDNWLSTEIQFTNYESTARWFGYAYYNGNTNMDDKFITFSTQTPSIIEPASSTLPNIFAADYVDNQLWFIAYNHSLYKAAVDEGNGIISSPFLVAENFEESHTVDMSYNPVDDKLYYVTVNNYLKSFSTSNPQSSITTIGQINADVVAFAINADGQAYCISTDGKLYNVNLSNASTTLKGNTGKSTNNTQAMAFDRETGELFWSFFKDLNNTDSNNNGLYLVETTNGHVEFLGSIGGGTYITALFTPYEDISSCVASTEIEISNITGTTAVASWDGEASYFGLKYRTYNANATGEFYDFEGIGTQDGMQGWTTINADGDNYNWHWNYTSDTHSGSGQMTSESYVINVGELTPNNYLVSPQFTAHAGDAITFWAKGFDPQYYAEHFGVAVSTTGNTNTNNFTMVSEEFVATNDWAQYTVDLSAYAGQNIYVAIRHYNCTDMYRLYVDDVTIGTPQHGSSNILQAISGNTYTLGNLQPNTTYELTVMSGCSEATTTFTTEYEGVEELEEAGISVWNRNNEIHIDIANSGNYTMNLVNILGQIVMTSNISGQGSHTVAHNLTGGVYIVTFSNADNNYSTKIVVR